MTLLTTYQMAERAILNLQAESTKKTYTRIVKSYEQFRGVQGHSEAIVLVFIVKESESKAATTLWTYYSLLKKYLLLECDVDLGVATRIADFLKTISRHHIKKEAAAFTREQLNSFFRDSPNTGRDLVIKLIAMTGYYGGLCGCEIVALCWDDVYFSEEGILIKIMKSKTDQARVGATKLVPKLPEEAICPVFYFTKYRDELKEPTGRLFKQYHNGKFVNLPVGKTLVAEVPSRIALFLGLEDPRSYTGHALRVSSATALAYQGADIFELKRHGRWASSSIEEEYLRESKHARLQTVSKLSGTELTLKAMSNNVSSKQGRQGFNPTNCVFNGPVCFIEAKKDE